MEPVHLWFLNKQLNNKIHVVNCFKTREDTGAHMYSPDGIFYDSDKNKIVIVELKCPAVKPILNLHKDYFHQTNYGVFVLSKIASDILNEDHKNDNKETKCDDIAHDIFEVLFSAAKILIKDSETTTLDLKSFQSNEYTESKDDTIVYLELTGKMMISISRPG